MAVQITIRDVPDDVRNELAARAARERKSMQEYLREKLEQLARKPTIDTWLEAVRQRKALCEPNVSLDTILSHRDADRR